MMKRESNPRDRQQRYVRRHGFADSHAFFALFLICMFVVAIAFALVGLTATPAWLGFS